MSKTSTPMSCPVFSINQQEMLELLGEAAIALELCLECDGLTWEAEQEASAVHRKLKQISL